MKKFEAYLQKQLMEKFGTILFFVVVMLYPNSGVKMFSLFFLIILGLASDAKQKRLDLLTTLPFTHKEIFWFEYGFISMIILLTFLIGLPFANFSLVAWIILLKAFIFFSTYYSVVILAVSNDFDPVGAAFLFLIFDAIVGGIGSTRSGETFNPYKYVSPLHQANVFTALAFALVMLFFSYNTFAKRGGER